MHDLTPIWGELLAAAQDRGPRPPTLEQYLVNGCMLVTWKQYAELRRTADKFEREHLMSEFSKPRTRPRYESIQVIAVGPTPVDVGADKIAFTVGDNIYVADKSALDPPMPLVPARGYRITENQ